MAEQLFDEFGQKFEITLTPSSGGVYEVDVDGREIFSKKVIGRHAEYQEIAAPIREILSS